MDSAASITAFLSAFNDANWNLLRGFFHPGQDEKTWHDSMAYVRGLRNAGYRVESYSLSAYQQPAWPMFNECYFYPPPEEGVYFLLKDKGGRSQQLFFGLSGSKFCYYVEKKAVRKTKRSSARVWKRDFEKISRFVANAVERYSASSTKRISALELLFSTREGFVSIGFQHSFPYAPGKEPFSTFDCCLVPGWMGSASESKDLQIVGEFLVEMVLKMKTTGQFDALPRRHRAEISIEENEGRFSWPKHADHGRINLM